MQTAANAYQAGVEAAIAGTSWKANPHPTLSRENIAWANGHLAGTDKAQWDRYVARGGWVPKGLGNEAQA